MLSQKQEVLLEKVLNKEVLFCKNDNCLQSSNRAIATKLNVSLDTINSLMKQLKIDHNLVIVKDVFGVDKWMLNPAF